MLFICKIEIATEKEIILFNFFCPFQKIIYQYQGFI
jgi:hypothetical protein